VRYIYNTLKANTDYDVWIQNFTFPTLSVASTSNLTAVTLVKTFTLVYGRDFAYMGSIAIDGEFSNDQVIPVANLGCNATDYPPEVNGKIALIRRGNCTASEKIAAMPAGPKGAIIFNDGVTPDRVGLVILGLGAVDIPVIAMSYPVAQLMYEFPVANISVSFSIQSKTTETMNVIADMKVGRADSVIVVGSHLDSVPAGPGINDNGSGSALNLELALQLATSTYQKKIKNKIRFCWFGAEEVGLLGSNFYVYNLNATNQTALHEIAVNLNFDMVGSPNFIRGVYNGTNVNNTGAAVVQREFERFYNSQSIAIQITPFDDPGRSDYAAFLAMKIPAGGLFTGAEVVKSIEERGIFGGMAGASFDPCYHQACDTVQNINQGVLLDMAQGAAHVLEVFATQDNLTEYLTIL